MTSTRERKERFIRSFGPAAPRQAVLALFGRYGLDILSDEMLAEITSEIVWDARDAVKRNRKNRQIYAESLSECAKKAVA